MATYEKRKSGWAIRFRYICNGEEKQKRLTGFPTKKAANLAYAEFIKLNETNKKLPEAMTIQELCEAYLRDNKDMIKESSLYEIGNRLRNHILPTLGDIRCDKLTPLDLLQWQTGLTAEYSRAYVLVLRYALSAVWSYGTTYHDLPDCPLRKVKQPKDTALPKQMNIWTKEEYSRFREAVSESLWRLFFDTLILTGMRKGEALALTPSDINGVYVSICKSITRKGDSAWNVTTPKTKESVRKIRVPQDLADRLRSQPGPFIFGGNAPFADRTVERRYKDAIALSRIKPIRMHDMRHTHASWLISSGCSIVAVSKRLGHKSVKQTLDIYSHMMPEDDEAIINVLPQYNDM